MASSAPPKRRLLRKRKKFQKRHADLGRTLAFYIGRFNAGDLNPFGDALFLMVADPCVYCGDPDARTWDHLDSLAGKRNRGEVGTRNHYARACRRCNMSKFSTPLLLYLVQRKHRRDRTGKPNFR